MRVAIIGAGISGLTAGYELVKRGIEVDIFERRDYPGGLASGVRRAVGDYPPAWDWDLEQFYHHWFTNDDQAIGLARDLGLSDAVVVRRPISSTWFHGREWQLDSPSSLLRFRPLPWSGRLRTGLALAYLKLLVREQSGGCLSEVSAKDWLERYMGRRSYQVLWKPLLEKKFGPYSDQISMQWFWARIFKRTPRLVYIRGGMTKLIDRLESEVAGGGGELYYSEEVSRIEPGQAGDWRVKGRKYEAVVVTVAPPRAADLMPEDRGGFAEELRRIDYLGSYCLILVMDQPFLERTYWLNVNDLEVPFLAVVEHTNFVSSQHYGGKHIVYLGGYLSPGDPLFKQEKGELLARFLPYLTRLHPRFDVRQVSRSWLFKSRYAQPIVGSDYRKRLPSLRSPYRGIYLAGMAQIYPWDRGMNYGIDLARKAARLVAEELS